MDIREHWYTFTSIETKLKPVYWNRDGMVGRIPLAVIDDVVSCYLAYKVLKERGRIAEVPPASCTISWDQVENVRPESASPANQGEQL